MVVHSYSYCKKISFNEFNMLLQMFKELTLYLVFFKKPIMGFWTYFIFALLLSKLPFPCSMR